MLVEPHLNETLQIMDIARENTIFLNNNSCQLNFNIGWYFKILPAIFGINLINTNLFFKLIFTSKEQNTYILSTLHTHTNQQIKRKEKSNR